MTNLASIKNGVYFSVVGISPSASFKIRRRLYELGFIFGTKVRVVRKSLTGQAYLVELRDFNYA